MDGAGRPVPVLGPRAAVCAWAAVIVSLSVTGEPLIVAATFVGLVSLALRSGHRRLVLLAVIVGAGLLIVVPGIATVDGSLRVAVDSGAWTTPRSAWQWAMAIGGALRIPAEVLASCLLLLVPAPLLLSAAARLSPRTALVGGLAARLRPLLARDLRLVSDELAARGLCLTRPAPFVERARAAAALWEAAISGVLERAFQTAAALDTRGFATGAVNNVPFQHPELRDPVAHSPILDRLVLAVSALLVAGVIWARSLGSIDPPPLHAFGSHAAPASWAVVVLSTMALALGALPLLIRPRTPLVDNASSLGVRLPDSPAASHPLQLEHVSMQYPTASAPSLTVATLQVLPGELIVLAGPSGSGKSTLLDVITGVAPHSTGGTRTGTIRLGAHVLGGMRNGAERIAAVFQDPETQILVGRVADEIAFGPRHMGLPLDDIERRVIDVLERLDVRHLATRDCTTLSGGELQRVLLAAALALDPSVLVLDEPTSQVDAHSEARFWDAVDLARSERGVAVIAAEHRLDHILTRANRIVVVAGGHIVADIPSASIAHAAPHLMDSAYTGLVPQPPHHHAPARLTVRFERIDVPTSGGERRTLFRGLACALPPRSIVTLEGPNGTGKSTLLRSMIGLHTASGGVLVDGIEPGSADSRVRNFGFLSQSAGALLPGRTVRHAIEATSRRLHVDVATAHAALHAAGLSDRLDQHPGELSVGERQRLALVAATAHCPPIWLLDEPTRGMDAAARRWVACHILAHAAAGGVVLVATHDPALAAAIATHRLRLDMRTGPTLLVVPRDTHGGLLIDTSMPPMPNVQVDA